MADNKKILTAEEENALRRPMEEYVGKIQAKIDSLRKDGTDVVIALNNHIQLVREDKNYTRQERAKLIEEDRRKLGPAKEVEEKNKAEIERLIAEAEKYLDEHFEADYYSRVTASCDAERAAAKKEYESSLAQLKQEHEKALAGLSEHSGDDYGGLHGGLRRPDSSGQPDSV